MSSRSLSACHSQRGAALAVALVLLIVLTLLGIAAVRATQTELRLAMNAESRVAAQQNAESLLNAVLSDPANTPLNSNPSARACRLPANLPAALFTCPDTATQISLVRGADSSASAFNRVPPTIFDFGYVDSVRELPLFVSVDVLREGKNSARNYDFARYSVTSGYDRSADGLSASEVVQSVLVLHPKATGVGYE